MSLIRAMMGTMSECALAAVYINQRALNASEDMLDDLSTVIEADAKWSHPATTRFPDPFPWTEVTGAYIDGREYIRTEDDSCDCIIYRVDVTSSKGYGVMITANGANEVGLANAKKLLVRFYNKVPAEILSNFAMNAKGTEFVKTSK